MSQVHHPQYPYVIKGVNDKPKETERQIWDRAVAEAKREPVELRDNRPAIRRALKESRWQHTKRVRSILP